MTDLLAVTGRAAGIRYALADDTTIGRASECTIQLLDDAVSRRHVAIRKVGERHEVEDLKSANGSTLNGRPLTAKTNLVPGDTIGVGATTFVYAATMDYVRGDAVDVIVHEQFETSAERDVAVGGDEASAASSKVAATLLSALTTALEGPGRADLVQTALEAIAAHFGAERAFVLTRERGARPKVRASRGEGPITISRTVLDRVLEERRAIVSADTAQDVLLKGGVSLAAGEVRSLIAAPLVRDGRAFGIVHLDARRADLFGPTDLETLVPLANVLALVLLASDGLERLGRQAREGHRIEKPEVVAESPAMKRVVSEAERAATSDATVLVTGPTGTGKELIARLVHATSDRRDGPFVAVNCGALVDTLEESELFGHEKGAFTGADDRKIGLFEAADGGTLFLDEVGDTSRATQVKLLRALQERAIFRVGGTRAVEVDTRIVAATSRRLEEAVAAGDMREDLFYRLSVVRIEIPPLSARPEDIVPIATSFVRRICRSGGVPEKTLSPEAATLLASHRWDGNVRELGNMLERVVILSEGEAIEPADLPLAVWTGGDLAADATAKADTLQEAVARLERAMILRAIARTGAVKTAVADALGISRVTLDKKLELHDIAWPKRRR